MSVFGFEFVDNLSVDSKPCIPNDFFCVSNFQTVSRPTISRYVSGHEHIRHNLLCVIFRGYFRQISSIGEDCLDEVMHIKSEQMLGQFTPTYPIPSALHSGRKTIYLPRISQNPIIYQSFILKTLHFTSKVFHTQDLLHVSDDQEVMLNFLNRSQHGAYIPPGRAY